MNKPRDAAPQYRSFVLRLWPANRRGQTWRISLQEIGQASAHDHFSDLDALFSYLITLTRASDLPADEGIEPD